VVASYFLALFIILSMIVVRSDISGFIKALNSLINEERCAVIFWFWLELVS
jgi:hypothetical protein